MSKWLTLLIVVSLLALSVGTIAAKPGPAPEIEKGVFVDYGYDSPPWYPPTEETDSYRWAPRVYWATGILPVDVTVYTGDEPISGTFAAIEDGFTAWDDETGTSLYGTIEEKATSSPGVVPYDGNTVQWGTIDGPGGIVAVTYYWYWANTKEMVEFDIVLDYEEPWSLTGASNTFDVQNVITHEVGHTLVLQDLKSPRDGALTMHAYTWLEDTTKRTLGIGDILGVRAIYGE